MRRVLSFCLLAAAAVVPVQAQQRAIPKPDSRLPKAAARGPRLDNPGSPAARLYRATPEQRERIIAALPPRQQATIRQNLLWFDGLPKEDQEIVLRRHERFAALTPLQRRLFNMQMRALNQMRRERRQAIVAALVRLQMMPDVRRSAILASPEFRARFSAEEQKIIADLSPVMLPGQIQE